MKTARVVNSDDHIPGTRRQYARVRRGEGIVGLNINLNIFDVQALLEIIDIHTRSYEQPLECVVTHKDRVDQVKELTNLLKNMINYNETVKEFKVLYSTELLRDHDEIIDPDNPITYSV